MVGLYINIIYNSFINIAKAVYINNLRNILTIFSIFICFSFPLNISNFIFKSINIKRMVEYKPLNTTNPRNYHIY